MRVPFRSSKNAASGARDTWLGSAACQVYDRTARRSFIAKVGAVLVTAGVAPLALQDPASADAYSCCNGPNCEGQSSLGAVFLCKGLQPGQCPAGTHFDGYTWTCCSGATGGQQAGKMFICTDCVIDIGKFKGGLCVCSQATNGNCSQTMTELARQHPLLQRTSS
jgi:hypothetical protein